MAILLPDAGAIAVGDTFVSGHPISSKRGPQMLHRMFHHQAEAALKATQRLGEVQATVILPGHGPALDMPLAEAVNSLHK